MSKKIELHTYKFRVTTPDTDKVMKIVKQYSNHYLVSLENPETNVHIQGYMETYTDIQTIRKAILKAFPELKGNRLYSLGKCDYREENMEYLSYLMKQDNWKCITLPKKLMTKVKEHSKTVKEEIKKKKESKKTILQQLDSKVVEIINTKYLSQIENEEVYDIIPDVVDVVLDYYKEKDVLFREFQVKSLIQTLLLKHGCRYKSMLRHKYITDFTYQFYNVFPSDR